MSELKETSSGEIRARDALLGYWWYEKSEADKEIDFWKKESHDHYERWFGLNKQYEGWLGKVMRCERAERELRHQKYKRCLDKASYWLAVSYQCVDDKHRQNAIRHRRKWFELAKKFKDVQCQNFAENKSDE